MPTFVLLTRLSPEATRDPKSYDELVENVRARLRRDCPDVKWLANYWLLGPYDYMDIYEAPSEEVATKVSAIIRTFGRSTPETWTAVSFDRFLELVHQLA
ncbi:MAG: GYD domain-containing protein [Dehalococcoidia bacterium]